MQVKFSLLVRLSVIFICFKIFYSQSGEERNFLSGMFKQVLIGQRLINALITIEAEVDFIGCIESCIRRRRCKSVNYFESFKMCELNYKPRDNENAEIVNESSVVYSYKDQWEETELSTKVCRPDRCDKNEQCLQNAEDDAQCVISDCRWPIKEDANSYSTGTVIGLYSKVIYKCRGGYNMEGTPRIGCQTDGIWSPFRFNCSSVCEMDWRYFQNSCYRLSETNSTWTNAKVQCEDQGAYLVDITSKRENEFIHNQANGLKRVWIGGTDNEEEGVWKWVKSGRVFSDLDQTTYTNWIIGEPNGGIGENYMAMQGSNGKWVDISSDEYHYFYVCEKHTSATTS